MFRKRKKRRTAPNDAALLNEAIADLRHDLEVKARRRRRPRGWWWPQWLDRRVGIGIVVILLLLLIDGIWRENQEFYARVTGLGGQAQYQADDQAPLSALQLNQRLEDGNIVMTGPTGWAELSFPDGSSLVVDFNTAFRIKRLEYNRAAAWRTRSVYLMFGRLFARVGENFGRDSNFTVYTPACVAAVRGTRFSVVVPPDGTKARTVCGDGAVVVRGFTGQATFVAPATASECLPGGAPERPSDVPRRELSAFGHPSLNQIIRPEPWYTLIGLTFTQTLDAPLNILGIGKCSWFVGSIDTARRSRAQSALHLIQVNMEGEYRYPLWVNLATLAELKIEDPGAVPRILNSFDGGALETYWSDGRVYRITARARDRKRTRYELTPSYIRVAPDQT